MRTATATACRSQPPPLSTPPKPPKTQSLLVEAGEALQQRAWAPLLAKRQHPALWTAVLILHSCFCAPLLGELRDRWSLHLAATLAWAYGGGTVTALIAGDRTRAPLAVFAGNDVVAVWLPVWWLLNYAPWGLAERARSFLALRPCAALARGATALLRASLIVGRVDLAVTYLYPGSAAGALLMGTLAGASGRFLADAFRAAAGLPPLGGRPPEISSPGFTTRSAFFASVAHLLLAYGPLADGRGALLPSRAASGGLVVAALVAQSVLSDLLARPLDVTLPFASLAHRLTGVPLPPGMMAGVAVGKVAGGSRAAAGGGGKGRAAAAAAAAPAMAAAAPARRPKTAVEKAIEEAEGLMAAAAASRPRRTPARAAAARG